MPNLGLEKHRKNPLETDVYMDRDFGQSASRAHLHHHQDPSKHVNSSTSRNVVIGSDKEKASFPSGQDDVYFRTNEGGKRGRIYQARSSQKMPDYERVSKEDLRKSLKQY